MVPSYIYFNDSSSKINKELIAFFNSNLENIIKLGHISPRFHIVRPSDYPDLKKKGITKLPAMCISNTSYIGMPNIINAIKSYIKNSKEPIAEKTDDENVRDFMYNTLDVKVNESGHLVPSAKDDDDERDISSTLSQNLNRELERRKSDNKNFSPEDPIHNFSNKAPYSQNMATKHTVIDIEGVNHQPAKSNYYPGDPFESNNNIKNRGGEKVDDDMMDSLLNKLGGGDDF